MGHFPEAKTIETPLGIAEQIWATTDKHIGLSGTFEVNRVPYRVRIDLHFRDGEWKLGHDDTNSSAWNSVMISRDNWDYLKGRCPDPSSAARKKITGTLVPWLVDFAKGTGAQMITDAGVAKREKEQLAIWNNNSIQFPRLLVEIMMNVDITKADWESLCESMGLTEAQIGDIFDRAHFDWEKIKAELCTS